MADTHYLSIGEVLGLLLEDFPDVTISKIRFLESQGLIEPERTPSGYRKFYDHDVDLLRAILHEQRENFLPLKVIRDRIESGGIQADPTGGRTPPRGIRNVEVRPPVAPAGSIAPAAAEHRDSVFRRTDGGPEWADGRALIPGAPAVGESRTPSSTPITTSVPVIPLVPEPPATAPSTTTAHDTPSPAVAPIPTREAATPAPTTGRATPAPQATSATPDTTTTAPTAPTAPTPTSAASAPTAVHEATQPAASPTVISAATPAAPGTPPADRVQPPAPAPIASAPSAASAARARPAATDAPMPYNREELCAAAQISTEQLDELESYGLITPRGTGQDAAYPQDVLEIAVVAGRFLANGIDARHLRSWRQSADRESALFEQRIMPLLRQRNPASRQLALDTLTELAELGVRLHNALIDSALRHHFEGT